MGVYDILDNLRQDNLRLYKDGEISELEYLNTIERIISALESIRTTEPASQTDLVGEQHYDSRVGAFGNETS